VTESFIAPEYQADGTIRPARYAFRGSSETGWDVVREGRVHCRFGPGYRLLASSHCGVCATDLARRHLPFRLPQVTGHEVVARTDSGALCVVEINASHAARGVAPCDVCRRGLDRHCPDRLVLGIHDLPGGFGPWILAPVGAVVPLPAAISPATATLVEPFAAALHAVDTIAPADGDRIAVLGPRRLGLLVIAALAARRTERRGRYEILAIARRPALRSLARSMGADDALAVPSSPQPLADVVVDTTGHPDGLELAAALARREVHVKSTTGHPSLGLRHVTELVVDELTLAPASEAPPSADAVVTTSLAEIDAAIRPEPGTERASVPPRGRILVSDVGQPRDGVLAALLDRGLRFTTSRCGDLRSATTLLSKSSLGQRLGEQLVTDVVPADHLADAFERAQRPEHLKIIVSHPGGAVA